MNRISLTLLALLLAPAYACYGADPASKYAPVTSEITVGSSNTIAVTQTINLIKSSWVYLESDGRVFPYGGPAIADVFITVDGGTASNSSVTDWSVTTNGRQHSFNVIGMVFLNSGSHTIRLVGRSLNSYQFILGSQSNLSVLVNPANVVTVGTAGGDSATLNFNTNGLNGTSILPTSPVTSISVNGKNGVPVVVLGSERNYESGSPGDPLMTISLDGSTLSNSLASWADNDLSPGAESQASFFEHAFLPSLSSANHTISLSASELPYSGNQVQFRVGGDTRLIALQGLGVAGSAPLSNDLHNVLNYLCIATSIGSTNCPVQGTPAPIASGDINIPVGHNGIVFITGKTRLQGDHGDVGGSVSLYLTIDGVRKGSYGLQELGTPNSDSTRTMSTSFLTTGSDALSPGTHHVVLYAKGTGSFKYLSVTKDLPLIWFD